MEIRFMVQGSSDTPYEVVFRAVDREMSASCTCRAGEMGQLCKHRMQLLSGEGGQIVSGNESELVQLTGMLPNSDLKSALDDMTQLELDHQELSKQLKLSKKRLVKLLNRNL